MWRQEKWLSIHYTIKKRIMACKVVGGARAQWMVGQNAFKIRSWGKMVFSLESGVITEGSCSLVHYYDHVYSITRNTQLLYMLRCSYWLSRSDIFEIFPNMTTIALYLNYTK